MNRLTQQLMLGSGGLLKVEFLASANGGQIIKKNGSQFSGTVQSIPTSSLFNSELSFTADGNYLAVCSTSNVIVYKRVGDSYSQIASLSLSVRGACWTSAGTTLVVIKEGNSGEKLESYIRSGDSFTRNAPVIGPYPNGTPISICPIGNTVHVLIGSTQPDKYISVSGGTGVFNIQPPSPSDAVAATPGGGIAVSGHATSPFLTVYSGSPSNYTKQTDPEAPAGQVFALAFSPNSLHLAVGHDVSPFLTIYKRDGLTFTKLPTAIDVLPTAAITALAYSGDGKTLVANNISYAVSGDSYTRVQTIPNVSGQLALYPRAFEGVVP